MISVPQTTGIDRLFFDETLSFVSMSFNSVSPASTPGRAGVPQELLNCGRAGLLHWIVSGPIIAQNDCHVNLGVRVVTAENIARLHVHDFR